MTIDPNLLAQVREDIDSAKENGHDLFAEDAYIDVEHPFGRPLTDTEIAEDMNACTGLGDYEDNLDPVIAAIAVVRAERAS